MRTSPTPFKSRLARAIALLMLVLAAAPGARAGEAEPARPGPRDKCPVCGMFVSKYPDWIAQVVFHDAKTVFFDGAKDMFKFLLDLEKYCPGKTGKDVRAVFVTSYYDLKPINAKKAFFVMGSDVLGPMGRELVPFATLEEAREFMRDHKGKQALSLPEVTPEVIGKLD